MDNHPRPEEGNANAGLNVPATDASSLTADNENKDAAIQRANEDAIYLMSKESDGYAPMFTSDGTAHTNQALPASLSRNESTSSSKNLQCYSLSSSLESEWNICHYQFSQKADGPVNEILYNNEYQYNIGQFHGSQMDNAPINTEFFNNVCQMNISQYQGTIKDNAPVEKAFLNNESRWNIGQFQGSQRDYTTVKSADANESVGGGVHSGDLILAVSGSSGLHGNQNEKNVLGEKLDYSKPYILASPDPSKIHAIQNEPKVLGEKLKLSNASNIQSVPRRIFTCLYCGEGFDKHTKIHQKETIYACCVCKYTTKETLHTLQNHICIHCSKNHCNECSKYYTEGTLHVLEQTCQLCTATFRCRTQFDEHLQELHLEYSGKNCWECYSPVSAHYTRKEGNKLFFCCTCGYETNNSNNIQFHNEGNRPKTFCKICKEEYSDKQKIFHNSNYSCIKCDIEFKCKKQLEDHYQGDISHVEYFSVNCRLCNGKINEHREEKSYKCCDCHKKFKSKNELQNHFQKHTGLKIFKCDECGELCQYKSDLFKHKQDKCIPLNFLCEICKARFPKEEFLTKHCLEKHSQTT